VNADTAVRIRSHTIQDAPVPSQPLLAGIVRFSPTGKLLNLHAQMAHSPAVLAAYAGIRQAATAHAILEARVRSALMLATAGVAGNAYAEAITAALARREGWSQAQVLALRDGQSLADDKIDSLVGVVREAAAQAGLVSDVTWEHATRCGWSSEQLTEAFACLGLALFTAYFANYARTPLDLPAAPGTEIAAGAAPGAGTGATSPAGAGATAVRR
jgi:hypothetical protein